jgi:hypothetical protein
MRIALLTLPSVMSAAACLAFAEAETARLALLGLSDPGRVSAGGTLGQMRRHLARSGPAILPYLALGFGLPGRRRDLARLAQGAGASCVTVDDVNGPAMRAAIRAAGADLIVTLHFDQILAAETIALAPLGGINLHPSLLPRHRGPIPAFWALAEGEGRTGVTVHRLVPRIDAGPVLAQRGVALPAGLSALEAARRLHLAGVPLLREVVSRLAAGAAVPELLPDPLPYCPFPDAASLREARRRGVTLTRVRDVGLLFRDPPGG